MLNQTKIFIREEINKIKARRLYSRFLKSGDYVMDVGANKGKLVNVFLRMGCKVLAIEPVEKEAVKIKNKYPSVKVFNLAISNNNKPKTLYTSEFTDICTLNKEWVGFMSKKAKREYNNKIVVECRTLNYMIEKYGKPVFIKIDVEGHELKVLEGLNKKNAPKYISVEYSTERLKENKKIIKRLVELGYNKFNLCSDNHYRPIFSKGVNAKKLENKLIELKGSDRMSDIYAIKIEKKNKHPRRII